MHMAPPGSNASNLHMVYGGTSPSENARHGQQPPFPCRDTLQHAGNEPEQLTEQRRKLHGNLYRRDLRKLQDVEPPALNPRLNRTMSVTLIARHRRSPRA